MAIWSDRRRPASGTIREVLTAVAAPVNDRTMPAPTAPPAGIDLNKLANAIHDARNMMVHCEGEMAKAANSMAAAEAAFWEAVAKLGIRGGK